MSSFLLLNGLTIPLSKEQRVVFSKQANNLTRPDAVQADFSNTFKLPLSKELLNNLGHPEDVRSTTKTPYRQLPASYFDDGTEMVVNGKAIIQSTEKELEVQVLSGNVRLFDVLGDKKLSELDFSELTHPWTKESVAGYAGNTFGFFYPLIDYGKPVDFAGLDVEQVFPAVYAKRIWQKIFEAAGFQYTMEEPEQFEKLAVGTSELPKYSKEFTDARSVYGAVAQSEYEEGNQSGNRADVTRTIPFAVLEGNPYFTATNGNFDSVTYSADVATYVNIDLNIFVYMKATIGTASARLSLLKNGVVVKDHYIRTTDIDGTGMFSYANGMPLTVSVQDFLLQPGDTLQARIHLQGETDWHRWGYRMYHRYFEEKSYPIGPEILARNTIRIAVQQRFPEGAYINLSDWLPDMSQKDFVKSIVKAFGLTMQTDPFENLVRVTLFKSVVDNKANSKDWSSKMDHTRPPRIMYRFGDFAQQSWFNWKPDESVTEGLGDGYVAIDDTTLQMEKEVVAMPFAASDRLNGLLSIPLWERKAGTDPVEYDERKVQPRLFYRKDSFQALTLIDNTGSMPAEMPHAYFVDGSEAYDLDFQRVLIPFYYSTLSLMLNDTRYVEAYLLLSADDFVNFDQSIPVWVAYFGHYFYVNMLEQYESGRLTKVHLLRLAETE